MTKFYEVFNIYVGFMHYMTQRVLCALHPPDIDPYFSSTGVDGLFVLYSNPIKVIIYFGYKTLCINITLLCYIYEYYFKLHSEESMSLGTLMLQEYPFGVYQPRTTPPDPKIRLIQHSSEISDSPFASSDILTFNQLLLTSGTPINITILDDPISSIPLHITNIFNTPHF